jgi:type II secretory pathway pseudopilin PulG
MSPSRRPNSGITLVELMVVMTILLLLTGGISKLMLSAYDSEAAIRGQNLRQKQAQRCADAMVDSLRAATAITSGDETSLSATFMNDDRITYYLADRQLLCDTTFSGVTRTGQVISDQVCTLTFTYYLADGADWVETDTPTAARAVHLSVCLSDGKNRATESSAVKLRNEL